MVSLALVPCKMPTLSMYHSNMLTLSISVIAIALARIPNLKHLRNSDDPTFDHAPSFVWSCAETAVIHFCAAAPAVRSLFSKTRNVVTERASQYPGLFYGSRRGPSERSAIRSASKMSSPCHKRSMSKLSNNGTILSLTSTDTESPPAPVEKDPIYTPTGPGMQQKEFAASVTSLTLPMRGITTTTISANDDENDLTGKRNNRDSVFRKSGPTSTPHDPIPSARAPPAGTSFLSDKSN